MKIPWKKNTKSSPTKSTTKLTDRTSISCNVGAPHYIVAPVEKYDSFDDTTVMKMPMTTGSSNEDRRTTHLTTPVKPTVHCNGDATYSASARSSSRLLGSGHYSPVDGSVQTFAPNATLVSSTNDATTTRNTTSSTTVDTEAVFIQPTSLTFDQCSDDDYDVYLTPLQSSAASADDSYNHLKDEYELSVNKSAPLTVAESTLTDITTDATVDGEETKYDILLNGERGDDDPTTKTDVSVPPPPSSAVEDGVESPALPPPSKSPKFLRHASSFLRVSDLIGMDPTMDLSEHSNKSIPNYHCCSDTPPPGIAHDSMEKWVALDDGCCSNNTTADATMSSYTPIAQFAVDALAATALATMFDATMWVPDSKTAKIIESKPGTSWEGNTFQLQQPTSTNAGSAPPLEDHILIWSGTFRHGLYGSEIPAIRSAAIIYMSATQLLHLLMDSNRVKEYNTMSLGRTDLLTLPCRHIVTKVMRSESRPPLIRKTLQFTSILHARKLVMDDHHSQNNGDDTKNDNDSYLLVTRAVETPTTTTNCGDTKGHTASSTNNNSSVVVSEILLGVNVIRTIPHQPNACLLMSVNHVRSPMVPSLFLAKRLGLQAATNFVHDLRKCC